MKPKGIYCYIDKTNDEIVYIGKDSNIDKNVRHIAHKSPSCYNKQVINRIIQNNPDRYVYDILFQGKAEHIDNELLNILEEGYIETYTPLFNFTEGGEGCLGYKHSEEARKKISENSARYWKGKTRSEETKKKISEAMKGKHNPMYGKYHNEETKRRISENRKGKCCGENNPRFGKPRSEETKLKISEAKKGKKQSLETNIKNSISNGNSTGYLRVYKHQNKSFKQGFTYVYQYWVDGKRNSISSISLEKLEVKVKDKGLIWRKL